MNNNEVIHLYPNQNNDFFVIAGDHDCKASYYVIGLGANPVNAPNLHFHLLLCPMPICSGR